MTKRDYRPMYYRISLQDLRVIFDDFFGRIEQLINPDGDKITFLNNGSFNQREILHNILEETDLNLKGLPKMAFQVLDHCLKVSGNGKEFTYKFGETLITGPLIHPMTPKGREWYLWDRYKGGKPRYLSECGSVKSWVYAREIGIVPVQFGCHAIFMTYVYMLRHGADSVDEMHESHQEIQMRLLREEGVAFKSSVSDRITVVEGTLNNLELYHFKKAGYELDVIS